MAQLEHQLGWGEVGDVYLYVHFLPDVNLFKFMYDTCV